MFAIHVFPCVDAASGSRQLILCLVRHMSIVGQPSSAFWRFGLIAVALVAASTAVIRLGGPESIVALLVMPVFFVLFQVPYVLVAIMTEGKGVFRPIFFGSPWLVIPFWGVLVFLWNGSLAALFSFAYAALPRTANPAMQLTASNGAAGMRATWMGEPERVNTAWGSAG